MCKGRKIKLQRKVEKKGTERERDEAKEVSKDHREQALCERTILYFLML